MLNLSSILEESARRYPDHIAFHSGSEQRSYRLLNQRANQVAHGLVRHGIQPGDHVALSCPNVLSFPEIYYGILKAGAVVVPLNILLKSQEVAYHLADCHAKAYFCFAGNKELPIGAEGYGGFTRSDSCATFVMVGTADGGEFPSATSYESLLAAEETEFESVATSPTDTAVILYTSGTTGQAKGAELSHMNLLMNAWVSRDLTHASPQAIGILTLPMFHSFGQTVQMNCFVLAGATNVLVSRFEPAVVLGLMRKYSATLFAGVPTMYWSLLTYADQYEDSFEDVATNLKVCVSGGAPLPVDVLHRFERAFRVPIIEGYGLSETSPVACFNHLDRERKVGSIGTPVWGVSMRVDGDGGQAAPIGTEGELLVRGHNVMKGYFNRPEATAAAIRGGWLHTGDVAKMDEDGYYYIVDRVKDMIIRGGFNVYPREIEEAIMAHPAVSLVAVVGVPDLEHGEEIKAYVIRESDQELTEEELRNWCKQQMAGYKYPRHIEFRETLPMTATGKVLKRELRQFDEPA